MGHMKTIVFDVNNLFFLIFNIIINHLHFTDVSIMARRFMHANGLTID